MKSFLLFLATTYLVDCLPLPPPHPAVLSVRREEQQLPEHLRKPALWNPRLRDLLTLTSVLHHGETLVYEREADKIPRQKIYKMLTHAGLVPREQPHSNHIQILDGPSYNHQFPNLDALLANPDFLQHI